MNKSKKSRWDTVLEIVPEEYTEEELRDLDERAEASTSANKLYVQTIKDARAHEWISYRGDRYDMAILRKQQKEYLEALLVFLEVFYLDINGPQNVGHMFDPELDKGRKPKEWNPKRRFIAPAVIYYCQLMMKRTKTSIESVKRIFEKSMQSTHEIRDLPISPEDAWPEIEKSLTTKG